MLTIGFLFSMFNFLHFKTLLMCKNQSIWGSSGSQGQTKLSGAFSCLRITIFNRETKMNGIEIKRCVPDWNDLEWQTFSLIIEGIDLENPGDNHVICNLFKLLTCKISPFRPGTLFANPCGIVRTAKVTKQFIKKARQLQREWFSQMNSVLQSAGRVKRAVKNVEPIIRQLQFTGVLFIENHHIFPDRWPDSF